MISGATEEELIVANARGKVLNKCGKDILDILDNQNKEYEKKLENEVKYQNSEVVRLNNIIDEAIKYNKEIRDLYSAYETSQERSNAETNLCILEDKETLELFNELKGDNK